MKFFDIATEDQVSLEDELYSKYGYRRQISTPVVFKKRLPKEVDNFSLESKDFLSEGLRELINEADRDIYLAAEAFREGRRYIMTDTLQISLEGYMDLLDTKYERFKIALEEEAPAAPAPTPAPAPEATPAATSTSSSSSSSSSSEGIVDDSTGNAVVRFFKKIINFFYRIFKAITDKLKSFFTGEKKKESAAKVETLQAKADEIIKNQKEDIEKLMAALKAKDNEVQVIAKKESEEFFDTKNIKIEYPRGYIDIGEKSTIKEVIDIFDKFIESGKKFKGFTDMSTPIYEEVIKGATTYVEQIAKGESTTEGIYDIFHKDYVKLQDEVKKIASNSWVRDGKAEVFDTLPFANRVLAIEFPANNTDNEERFVGGFMIYAASLDKEPEKDSKGELTGNYDELVILNEKLVEVAKINQQNAEYGGKIAELSNRDIDTLGKRIKEITDEKNLNNGIDEVTAQEFKDITMYIKDMSSSSGTIFSYTERILKFCEALTNKCNALVDKYVKSLTAINNGKKPETEEAK